MVSGFSTGDGVRNPAWHHFRRAVRAIQALAFSPGTECVIQGSGLFMDAFSMKREMILAGSKGEVCKDQPYRRPGAGKAPRTTNGMVFYLHPVSIALSRQRREMRKATGNFPPL